MRCRYTVIVRDDLSGPATFTRGFVEAADLEDAIEIAMAQVVEVVESLAVRSMSVRVDGVDGRAVTVTVGPSEDQ
jgi:hypothetical protein